MTAAVAEVQTNLRQPTSNFGSHLEFESSDRSELLAYEGQGLCSVHAKTLGL